MEFLHLEELAADKVYEFSVRRGALAPDQRHRQSDKPVGDMLRQALIILGT